MNIALVGNQNSGKTTLFNFLTGLNQKIGNWPGVTIEKKEGIIKGTNYNVIDLPGIYSLSPYTLEERIACNFLFEEQPDVIINIIDANSLERSLYLTLQLAELDIPIIIVLNMADIFSKKGGKINVEELKQALGLDVMVVSAKHGDGVEELISLLDKVGYNDKPISFSLPLENKVMTIYSLLKGKNRRFVAARLLEKDLRFESYLNDEIKDYLSYLPEEDFEEAIATERYHIIEDIKKIVMVPPRDKKTITEKIDKIVLNKYFSFPLFILIIFGLYFSVVLIGGLFTDFLESVFETFRDFAKEGLLNAGATPWIVNLTTDGILAGIGAVLTFIPQIIVLFIIVALLEASGYLSRVSFLLDKLFSRLGLSGRTLIPFIVGFGCSVPGVMATRTIENEKERRSATILVPFIPCGAKLPIIALFSGFFFKKYRALISTSLFFLSILLIIISALILKKIYKTKTSSYMSELPDYRLPDFKYVFHSTWDKTWSFIKNAGSIILVGSIVIWILLSFSPTLKYGVPIEKSILAYLGHGVAWFFYPIVGKWSWAAGVSAIQGLVAKEQVVASLRVIAGLSGDVSSTAEIFASPAFAFFTPASAYAFMAFNLFSAPCISAIGAMRRELGGTKAALGAALFQTGIAWVTSAFLFFAINIIGRLL